jgi:hypothetical protein
VRHCASLAELRLRNLQALRLHLLTSGLYKARWRRHVSHMVSETRLQLSSHSRPCRNLRSPPGTAPNLAMVTRRDSFIESSTLSLRVAETQQRSGSTTSNVFILARRTDCDYKDSFSCPSHLSRDALVSGLRLLQSCGGLGTSTLDEARHWPLNSVDISGHVDYGKLQCR